jgi:hypothetical protein
MTKFTSSIILLFFLQSCLLVIEEDKLTEINASIKELRTYLYYSYTGNEYLLLKDTIYLDQSVKLKFVDNTILKYEVFLDEELVWSGSSNDFELRRNNRKEGIYNLTIVQYVKTETHSLADKLHMEFKKYSDDFKLVIRERNYCLNFNIQVKDGTVVLTWDRYPDDDFVFYEIKKRNDFNYTYYTVFRTSTKDLNYYIDDSYVGGEANYILLVKVGDKIMEELKSFKVHYRPNLQLVPIAKNTYRFTWEKPQFYKNVNHVLLYTTNRLSHSETNGSVTSAIIYSEEELYGLHLTYDIYFNATRPDITDDIMVGKKIPYFDHIYYNHLTETYYIIHGSQHENPYPDGIYILNKDMDIIDAKLIDKPLPKRLVLSPDNKSLYLVYPKKIVRVDPITLDEIESYEFNIIDVIDMFHASNNNMLVVSIPRSFYFIEVFDYNKKEPIYAKISDYLYGVFFYPNCISDDGKYFVYGKEIFVYKENTFEKLYDLPYNDIKYLEFLYNEQLLLIGTSDKLYLYDYLSKKEIKEFDFGIPDFVYPSLDQQKATINICRKKGQQRYYFDILDLKTGARREINSNSYGILLNNFLFYQPHFRSNYTFYEYSYAVPNL